MQRCIQHSQLLLDFNHRFDSLERCSNGTPFFTGYALGNLPQRSASTSPGSR